MIQILAILKELFGFAGQVAANKGEKIALTEDEIRQRSKNKTERLEDKGHLKKWMAQVRFFDENLRAKERLHAKNQLRNLVKSDADILDIGMWNGENNGRTGNWLVITYMRDEYKREYLIEAK